MPWITRWLASAAILALSAVNAHAQDGDAAAGHAFAREACRACHMVAVSYTHLTLPTN